MQVCACGISFGLYIASPSAQLVVMWCYMYMLNILISHQFHYRINPLNRFLDNLPVNIEYLPLKSATPPLGQLAYRPTTSTSPAAVPLLCAKLFNRAIWLHSPPHCEIVVLTPPHLTQGFHWRRRHTPTLVRILCSRQRRRVCKVHSRRRPRPRRSSAHL